MTCEVTLDFARLVTNHEVADLFVYLMNCRQVQMLVGGWGDDDCLLNKGPVKCRIPPMIEGPLARIPASNTVDPYVPPSSLYLFWGKSSATGTVASHLEGRTCENILDRKLLAFKMRLIEMFKFLLFSSLKLDCGLTSI